MTYKLAVKENATNAIKYDLFALANFLVINNTNFAFSALMLLVGWQEWHLACKKLRGRVLT